MKRGTWRWGGRTDSHPDGQRRAAKPKMSLPRADSSVRGGGYPNAAPPKSLNRRSEVQEATRSTGLGQDHFDLLIACQERDTRHSSGLAFVTTPRRRPDRWRCARPPMRSKPTHVAAGKRARRFGTWYSWRRRHTWETADAAEAHPEWQVSAGSRASGLAADARRAGSRAPARVSARYR